MASAWCLYSHFRHAIPAPSLSCKEVHRLKKLNRMQVLCCESDELHNQNPGLAIQYPSGMERRQVLFRTLLAAFSFPPMVSLALADTDVLGDFRLYSDEVNKFKIMIPKDWQVGTGENNGIKSVTGFFPDEPSNSNVTVVITGLGADFTRLESFGKVDAFAENLVGGLDRSWQRPPGVAAKLIDSKTANGLYYIEYTLKNPGESRRHLISVLGIANNGWYNRLYTVTGQFVDEDSEKYGSKVEKAVASFRFI
ncbi:PsbP domain-containing protein [Actinidia chinensis var. chinensis]|uniref:PsbP domain-containing protein n=1 Tax=Actinidia chinensis var. chinensis TaxID=1590841 RepID=A0A2R6RM94_ACTCC|nr:PsbP domain-containing protein [Actinidia chinensis var. chinensis]